MKKRAPDIGLFRDEVVALMVKHGFYLEGNIRIRPGSDDRFDFTNYKCEIADSIYLGNKSHDRMGPFLQCVLEEKPVDNDFAFKKISLTLRDADVLLANGVESPINKKHFTNRHSWNEHLKAHGCVEFGNDLNKAKPREDVRGDFDCRKELSLATQQVMEKHGH